MDRCHQLCAAAAPQWSHHCVCVCAGQCCAHLQCAAWSEGVSRGEGQSLLYVDKAIDSGSTQVAHSLCFTSWLTPLQSTRFLHPTPSLFPLFVAGMCLLPTAGGDAALPADRLWAELPFPLRRGCRSSAGLDAETRCVSTALTPRCAHTAETFSLSIKLAAPPLELCFLLSLSAASTQCQLCSGSSDNGNLLMCCCCGSCYHGACLDPPISLSPLCRPGWQCPRCRVCQSCR